MLEFLKSVLFYKVTNEQTFTNKTNYDADITIKTNSSVYSSFNTICKPDQRVILNVVRQDYGNVIANVFIRFSNNSTIEYDFDIKNINCYDEVEINNTFVLFNGTKKGIFIINENGNESIDEPVLEKPINEPVLEKPVDEPVLEKPINEPSIESVLEKPVDEQLNDETPVDIINDTIEKKDNPLIDDTPATPENITFTTGTTIGEPLNKKNQKCTRCCRQGHNKKECKEKKHLDGHKLKK